MNKLRFLLALFSGVTVTFFNIVYAIPSFKINNQSNFYINSKDSGPGCPKQIAPLQSALSSEYWCGFVACATKNFDLEKGCLENNNHQSALTEGGYATWFSISFGNQACTVPDTNVYQCNYNNNGTLSFDYRKIIQQYSASSEKHQVGEVVEFPKNIAIYDSGISLRGINISGLEYDGTYLDALYQHPDIPDAKYFVEQGMNLIRLPIRWEFLIGDSQNQVNSEDPSSVIINNMYMASIYDVVEKYLKSGVSVDLDLHNYMRFCKTGTEIGQANEPTDLDHSDCKVVSHLLPDIWKKILTSTIHFDNRNVTFSDLAKAYPEKLIFGLMNEPYSDQNHMNQQLKTVDVFQSQLDTVRMIRKLGIKNLIFVSGNYWDPLHGFSNESPVNNDEPNGVVFNKVFTPEIRREKDLNIAVEVHQYFDSNYSGTHEECRVYPDYQSFKNELGLDSLAKWIRENGVKMFLGEFGAADNEQCRVALHYVFKFMNEHAYDASKADQGGFIGWAAWRSNRHGNAGFSKFNYLQAEDFTVYGATGNRNSLPGTGIVRGEGNGLMSSVFGYYLKP